jgi:uncharacterized protein DUF6163
MARTPTPRQPPLDLTRPTGGDRIEERVPETGPWRFGLILTWFMRLLAILWIVKGLGAWAIILGLWTPAGLFEERSLGYQSTIVYLAVVDLVAAVGLWMASTWGGVLWLLAVTSHLILAAFFPSFIPGSPVTSTFFGSLIAAYLVVSFLAARERH